MVTFDGMTGSTVPIFVWPRRRRPRCECSRGQTAATDLRNSLTALGGDGVDQVRAGTLPSLCFSILSRAEVLPLTERVPRPLLTFEQRVLLEDLKGEFGGVRRCEEQIEAFAAAWARLQHEAPGWPANADDRRFHEALLGWPRFHRAMLIGEVVPERSHISARIRRRPNTLFQHVLVDGSESGLTYVRNSLTDALCDADALLWRTLTASDADRKYNEGEELILQRVAASDEYKRLVKAADDDGKLNTLVAEAAEQGLWLGMALAYQFLVGGPLSSRRSKADD